ncbi:hypothetical protein NDU88_006731 [Pleurodeles waltl]|uniref:Uncharacterized protein n=1 Tax=Pleurodeles waltl TaxID=8319 RepID=A0AAV7RSQ0_PLEWA|nr:hypothetical protein NDU88_006731 [Pleurodeles waltl]
MEHPDRHPTGNFCLPMDALPQSKREQSWWVGPTATTGASRPFRPHTAGGATVHTDKRGEAPMGCCASIRLTDGARFVTDVFTQASFPMRDIREFRVRAKFENAFI